MSLNDTTYKLLTTDEDKIEYLEDEVAALNRVIALTNQDKLEKLKIDEAIFLNETAVEIFANGMKYVKCIVSKHDESEFIDISFLPVEGKVLQFNMTEKAFKKFIDVINRI